MNSLRNRTGNLVAINRELTRDNREIIRDNRESANWLENRSSRCDEAIVPRCRPGPSIAGPAPPLPSGKAAARARRSLRGREDRPPVRFPYNSLSSYGYGYQSYGDGYGPAGDGRFPGFLSSTFVKPRFLPIDGTGARRSSSPPTPPANPAKARRCAGSKTRHRGLCDGCAGGGLVPESERAGKSPTRRPS